MATGADPLCYIGELGPGMKVNRETPNLGPRISIMNNKGELLARIGDIRLGPDNMPSSEDGRGLIRDQAGKLVFA